MTAADSAAGSGETEETLRDGRVVTVRPLRAGDAAGVETLWRLRRLAEAARHAGVRRLAGDVPKGDVAILGVLEDLGLDYQEQVTAATVHADTDVDEMLRSLRSYRLLTGHRQSPPLDVTAFAELPRRVSAMVEDIPDFAELDLNPVFVRQYGAVAADVRVRLT